MTARLSLRVLSVAALLTVGATAAAAQSAASSSNASAAVDRWDANPTGKYALELAVPHQINKVNLIVSDSAGGLAAVFHPVGDRVGHPMTVRVQDNDMILQAFTPRGLFEIVLERQADAIKGRWTLGEAKGVVQGRVNEDATTP